MKGIEGSTDREFEHIDTDSTEFIEKENRSKELIKERNKDRQDNFFAEYNLSIIDEYFEKINSLEQMDDGPERDTVDFYLGLIREELELIRAYLRSKFDTDFDWYLNFFVAVTIELDVDSTPDDLLRKKANKQAIEFYSEPDSLDQDTLLKMLDAYRDLFKRSSEDFQSKVSELRIKFKSNIKNAIQSGLIDIPEERVDQVVDGIDPRLQDTHKEGPGCPLGRYDSPGEIIVYFDPESGARESHILSHEYFHAMSGRTILM